MGDKRGLGLKALGWAVVSMGLHSKGEGVRARRVDARASRVEQRFERETTAV